MSGPLIILGGGVALIAYLVYDWMQYRMRRRLRREGPEQGLASRVSYDWKVYAMLALTVILALLFARGVPRVVGESVPGIEDTVVVRRCLLIAAYILVIGVWQALRQARKQKISERMVVNNEVTELVNAFRSVFRIRPTVFSALEEANRKIEPPVGTAVAHAVTTFYVTSLPQRAFSELRQRVQNPYMDQFVYILERGEDARHEDIMEALSDLINRLRRAREIRDQSEVNMTVITGQTRVIQVIAIALVIVVASVPGLRDAYETAVGQILFIIIASVGVLTSTFIDRRATALKERVL
jgi:hypothetical protein